MMETQMFIQQLMQLGFNGELRKEIEVVDDQIESVKKLAQEYRREMMEFQMKNGKIQLEIQKLVKEARHEEARELSEDFQGKHELLAKEYIEKANEALLPHQIERLRQISKQQRVKSMNRFQDEFGIALSLADELGLTKEEKDKLIETIKRTRKKYYEEVAAAKKKANEEIMGVLTKEQQEKIREILGEEV